MARRTTPVPKKAPAKDPLVKTRFKAVVRPPQQFFRQWRKHRSLTLEAAAAEAGMTAGNLSAMERGEQGYTPAGLQALADVYKTSPGWLLEVNPLEQGDRLMTIIQEASSEQRKKLAEMAEIMMRKTGTDE